jgi:hypothetical protein
MNEAEEQMLLGFIQAQEETNRLLAKLVEQNVKPFYACKEADMEKLKPLLLKFVNAKPGQVIPVTKQEFHQLKQIKRVGG